MTTQYMQKNTQAAVIDECSSWLERVLARAAETIAVVRNLRARQVQLDRLGKLSARQLGDIGLDDPQVQMQLFDARIESGSEHLEGLQNLLQARR